MSEGEVTEELRRIYQRAAKEGIWIREFAPHGNKRYLAAAGHIKQLDDLEKKLQENGDLKPKESLDIYEIPLGVLIEMSWPGSGETREEACKEAVKGWKDYRRGIQSPLSKKNETRPETMKSAEELAKKRYCINSLALEFKKKVK